MVSNRFVCHVINADKRFLPCQGRLSGLSMGRSRQFCVLPGSNRPNTLYRRHVCSSLIQHNNDADCAQTGRTDIPLTTRGVEDARERALQLVGPGSELIMLVGEPFRVLTPIHRGSRSRQFVHCLCLAEDPCAQHVPPALRPCREEA